MDEIGNEHVVHSDNQEDITLLEQSDTFTPKKQKLGVKPNITKKNKSIKTK